MGGTLEVYVPDTLDIDWRSTFDDPDAVLQCQWRIQAKIRIQKLLEPSRCLRKLARLWSTAWGEAQLICEIASGVCVKFKFTLAFV